MMAIDFITLAQQCAPQVASSTLAAIVRTESGFNPYAIGVVRGRLLRQPTSLDEAIATVRALDANGWNYSVGLAQVNRSNWSRLGLTPQNAFDSCRNLAAGAAILQDCFRQASASRADVQQALRQSLSCYASGDFSMGYRTGYVQRVVDNAVARSIPTVPAIVPSASPMPVVPLDSNGLADQTRRRAIQHSQPGTNRTDPRQGGQEEKPDSSAVVF
ncbi:lytic transglycosylase domain-containing protein [Caballeronia sp. SEWSISQ10-4 2]|uniref:lytic transglycosylase domain-containing protein n=1 Tax=Caballeronia sp. SEWSISQ10-4 2 TaxID=2937438 RepID=UPI002656717D|nr:lytic transglycosylase domain-containing protein [Caballeronia sp. SEWSISQ10-4 2]MDN7179364.1 lytic transglycosylase domain-containing protein [Caballeronia sp. SEWSISQ10-4 2]